MLDERAFVARFEGMDLARQARVLRELTPEREQALRAFFGPDRFERLRELATKLGATRGRSTRGRGHVVVVPGFLGSALVVVKDGATVPVWPDLDRLMRGGLERLRLAEDGLRPSGGQGVVRAAGVLHRHYAELLLRLAARWEVRAFAYDWRKGLDTLAAELEAFLQAEFGPAPVRIVAHSLGGLVARTLLGRRQDGATGPGRTPVEGLVLLGSPDRGTFVVPQMIVGIDETIGRLARLAASGTAAPPEAAAREAVRDVFLSFPSLYEMLPRAEGDEDRLAPLYEARTYARFGARVPQGALDAALAHHRWLAGVRLAVPVARVEGYGFPTPSGIADLTRLDDPSAYERTLAGDGRVPNLPEALEGESRYYVREGHGGLVAHPAVLAALDELLETGQSDRLEGRKPASLPAGPSMAVASPTPGRARGTGGEDPFDRAVRRLRARGLGSSRKRPRGASRAAAADASGQVVPDERTMEELVGGGFLGAAPPLEVEDRAGATEGVPKIRIELINAGIERAHRVEDDDQFPLGRDTAGHFRETIATLPVDSIAVGHYLGVMPQYAEAALDHDISAGLVEREVERALHEGDRLPERGRSTVLAQFSQRGILRGELGQPFLLPDPRRPPWEEETPHSPRRLIAIAGMGEVGRFGTPELIVLVRELCWTLGRLGQRHLATVLIGSGVGNLTPREALNAWLRGVLQAFGSAASKEPHLEQITFVEQDPRRALELDGLIAAEVGRVAGQLDVEYRPKSAADRADLRRRGAVRERREWEQRARERTGRGVRRSEVPTRVTLRLEGDVYHFGAITNTASIPERKIPLRRFLVEAANRELAAEADPVRQLERGRFLGQLLIPRDLRDRFFSRDPLVLMLDATTARVHWEMVAQSETDLPPPDPDASAESRPGQFREEFFLATARGLTRQLRTTFAPPPEPPPPPRRTLRVLVVADPASDAPLPGAAEEGAEVADLFESFNAVYPPGLNPNRIEVVRLFGPTRATPTNVLREVTTRAYDVLHFAGHCFFDPRDPVASGWVFSRGEVLTADLLERVDRVPKFVFSNACESGVTPERPAGYSVGLAPGFAEAFFARGVANFVCTAWPVDDLAARRFALRLYAGLLGLRVEADRVGRVVGPAPVEPMHQAMLEARLAIARRRDGTLDPDGARTWGAYQHYGDPFLRLFDPSRLRSRGQDG